MMTGEWFREYVFEVVVDKAHVPDNILEANKTSPTVLPPWDPMGMLAH